MGGDKTKDGSWPGDRATEDGGETVITLSWQMLLLPIVAVGVIGVGYLFGRAMAADNPSQAAPAAPQVGVSQPGDQGQASPINPGDGSNVIQLPPVEPYNPFPNDRVIDLPPPSHPLMNQPAPDFTMTLLSTGEDVSLSDYRGQPVLVNFWATWCPPCRFEMPWIESVYQANKVNNLEVLAVDAGERVPPSMVRDTIEKYWTSMGLSFPVLWGDSTFQVQREWFVTGLPSTFFINAEGTVVDMHQGMFPNQVTLEDRVNRFLQK